MLLERKHRQKYPHFCLFVCMWRVCVFEQKANVHVFVFKSCVCVCARATHSSVVSLGMPLGRECSPLLLHRTTPSEHVQTSGQPDAGRQPLSSAPGRRGRERERERVSGILGRDKEKKKERDTRRMDEFRKRPR